MVLGAEPWTSTCFPETRYPGLGTGRGKDCASVGILEDFSILLKTLSHYSKFVLLLNKQFLSFSPVSGIERRLSSGGGHCEPSRCGWEPPETERRESFL